MSGLIERLFELWQEPVDLRDDPESAFRGLYADPVDINGAATPVASLVERARALQHSFADLSVAVVDYVETADRAVVAFYMRGRQTGPVSTVLGEVPATDSSVEIRTIDVLTLADGKITALWVVSDELGMLGQLGARLAES
jgi:SnoaL-like polyketide cyclase